MSARVPQIFNEGVFNRGSIYSYFVLSIFFHAVAYATNPIPIASIQELQKIGNDPAYPLDGSYILTQDIDASQTASWNDGKGFKSIGPFYYSSSTPFTGTFNGQGYTISSLFMDYSSKDGMGLFGYVSNTGQIENVRLIGEKIHGSDWVGGLIGINEGTVTRCSAEMHISASGEVGGLIGINSGTVSLCYASGKISAYASAGGLIGYNDDSGTVTQCYATAKVTGYTYIGGLAGYNAKCILNCYATGMVSGGNYVSGLVGYDAFGTITNCYATGKVLGNAGYAYGLTNIDHEVNASFWNTELSGQSTSNGGTGITTSQLLQSSTFLNAGWDYSQIWTQSDGQTIPHLSALTTPGTTCALTLPIEGNGAVSPPAGNYLMWRLLTLTETPGPGYDFAGWFGENLNASHPPMTSTFVIILHKDLEIKTLFLSDSTKEIHTIEDLQRIGNDASHPLWWKYAIEDDIDASGTAEWNDGAGFVPIGGSEHPFSGILDGKDHVITGLTINRPDQSYIGLCGYLGPEGCIKNVVLNACVVSGFSHTGAFIGQNNGGSLTNCSTTCTVSGSNTYIGGAIGWNSGTVTQCHASGTVSGHGYAGGLIGLSNNVVTLSYATGSVSGTAGLGGLIGENREGTVSQSYACSVVLGSEEIGGLLGRNNRGTLVQSYSLGDVTGDSKVGGLAGENWIATITQCYAACRVSGGYNTGGLAGYDDDGEVENSFWDTEISGQTTSAIGTGITMAQLVQSSTFLAAGWDYGTVWTQIDGQTVPNLIALSAQEEVFTLNVAIEGNGAVYPSAGNYPPWTLLTLIERPEPEYAFAGWFSDGLLAAMPPMTSHLPVILYKNSDIKALFLPDGLRKIHAMDDFSKIGTDPSYPLWGSYTLENDIDASATASWNYGAGFHPIGAQDHPFTGILDGQGHVITGLVLNWPAQDYVGLVGYLGPGGCIKNLDLKEITVSGQNYVGGLAGYNNNGEISMCCSSGSISGSNSYTGGLIGWSCGRVLQCHSSGMISGNKYVGGLIGENDYGTMSQTFSTGAVSGTMYVGGLAGVNACGTVTRSYKEGSVSGERSVGGLAGLNDSGNMTQCYAAGPVSGSDRFIGGVAGSNQGGGMLTQCYSVSMVTGHGDVGGLVGDNYLGGIVNECYAAGKVDGYYETGGLIGLNYVYWHTHPPDIPFAFDKKIAKNPLEKQAVEGTVTNSFWDMETSGQATSAAGTGITTAQLLQSGTFIEAGWDYEQVWTQLDGQTVPYLLTIDPLGKTRKLTIETDKIEIYVFPVWTLVTLQQAAQEGYEFVGWSSQDLFASPVNLGQISVCMAKDTTVRAVFLPNGPLPLHTIEEIQKIGMDCAYPLWRDYQLTNDIDASQTAQWNHGDGFIPIGNDTFPFTGSFDGQDHVISGLTIHRPNDNYIGLFGCIRSAAGIYNLQLHDVTVKGNWYVGGLIGQNSQSTVSQCSVTGAVAGINYIGGLAGTSSGTITRCYTKAFTIGKERVVGGLVGDNDNGSVTQCFTAGDIAGLTSVGGLIGINAFYGTVTQCYTAGAASGQYRIGGCIGVNEGAVVQCYAASCVSAEQNAGGLISDNQNTVTDSYWDTQISDSTYSDGGMGKTTTELLRQETFANWDFSTVWHIIENTTFPYLQGIPAEVQQDVVSPFEGAPEEGEGISEEGEDNPQACEGESVDTDNPLCMRVNQTFSSTFYMPFNPIDLIITLQTGAPQESTAIVFMETLPQGWTFTSMRAISGDLPSLTSSPGDTGTLSFLWFTPLNFPYTFVITVTPPLDAFGPVQFYGHIIYPTYGLQYQSSIATTTINCPACKADSTLLSLALTLQDHFQKADGDNDGQLTYEEAVALTPELTQEQFLQFDVNLDTLLSTAELTMYTDQNLPVSGCYAKLNRYLPFREWLTYSIGDLLLAFLILIPFLRALSRPQ
ncbi:MAG TPA: GLUG motif-containing protein [Candidatus Hydrogenedentes bacterium]|nr:GLUG motif-containing protein [Candidatus Hydrogenedentota bacterium]